MGSVCVMKTGFWPSFSNQALLGKQYFIYCRG